MVVTPRAFPDVGGVESHVFETTRRLAAWTREITLLTTDVTGTRPPLEYLDGVRVVRVRATPKKHDYYFAPGVYRHVRFGQFDLVHCQSYHTFVAPLAMLAARMSGTPYVVSFHSGPPGSAVRRRVRALQHKVLRPLLSRADGLICVSEFERSLFGETLKLPPDRFHVVPNGADLPDPGPVEAVTGRVVASIGRLERYKGHHRLIQALPHLRALVPDARAVIVGEGRCRTELEELARFLGVADAVSFSSVPPEDRMAMARLLRQASLVVQLSDYESGGIAAVEAVAAGTPVLVRDVTGLRELIGAGWAESVAGDAGDEDVARAIARCLGGERRAVPAKSVPTWDACARGLLEVYAAAVSAHRIRNGHAPEDGH